MKQWNFVILEKNDLQQLGKSKLIAFFGIPSTWGLLAELYVLPEVRLH